jgi:transcriptional regulator with XRE-family HTH domain
MSHLEQLTLRRYRQEMSMTDLARLSRMDISGVSDILEGKSEPLESDLDALAEGLNAKWVLVPTEFLPQVRKLLNVTGMDPDFDAPSAVEMFLKSRNP